MLRRDQSTLLLQQLCRIARRDVALGAVRRVTLAAAFIAVIPQTAYADTRDDNVACIMGKAVVNLHKGSSKDHAVAKTWTACEALAKGNSENELEGISDFVYMTFEKLAASSAQ